MMTTKKKALAAAVAVAFCGAAQAEVVMYGTVMPFLENAKTDGATTSVPSNRPNMVPASAYTGVNDPSRSRITVGTTNWGFRGSEQLNGSLKAVWQLESAFQIDQNTGPGLGARNSKLGLTDKWGEIFFGQWDTPYKSISLPINPFRAGYVFDYTPIMGNPGLGVPVTTTQPSRAGAKPDAAFDKRAGNSVQYWSPNFAGLSFKLGWSVDEGAGTVASGGPFIRPQIYSAALQYDRGSLSLRYAYEEHKDYFGMSVIGGSAAGTAANPGSKDKAHRGVVLWKIANTRITGTVEQLQYHNDDATLGAVNDFKRTAYYAVVEQFFGPSSVWLSYGRAQDGSCSRVGGASCSTNAMGANYWTVGAIHRFSKRTEVFAAYYRLTNKESGTYATQPTVGGPIAPGADTTGAGVGMIHYF